jgi:hypothetical protein
MAGKPRLSRGEIRAVIRLILGLLEMERSGTRVM